jgi:ATP-dependent protease Clp ATPase subunit
VSGAFVGLEEIIKKRLHQQAIGFKHERNVSLSENGEYLKLTKAEDLIEYGFESEFVGRLPVVVHLNTLDIAALYQILKNPSSSVILSKKRDFLAYGIELEFDDAAFHVLAEMAYEERTGARGILSALEKTLIKYEKKFPSTQIRKLVVTKTVVQNPVEELNRLLLQESLHQFQRDFQLKTGIVLNFTPEAIELIEQQAQQEQKDFQQKCQEIFQNYEYGLKLINVSEFEIDESILRDPQGKLEMLIKRTYQPVA